MSSAVLIGNAKPIPALMPVLDAIQVLMATTEPSRATSEPPELPGLIEASVWMYSAHGFWR